MISPELIEEIKFRCDIESVIGDYVPLKRAGSNLLGLCPFHSERTPSFTVFPATRSFYCFGCGAGGDVISFTMKRENVDYRSALEILARRVGIELPQENGKAFSEESVRRERILQMNREAAKYFHACLYAPEGAEGLRYLTGRGLSGATIKHFGLGFAPNSFGALTDYLKAKGYTDEEMKTGFLCGISAKTGKPYDYYRNRVIFPIIDVTGNVVAFGGRVMDDSKPKYLNTSDTPAFKKSRNLFALNYAKNKCAERLILCEGYMDVIALHAHGFENAVATLGTAITPEQARIMSRYTKQAVICYDSDEAGQTAANKAMRLLTEAGLDVRVLKVTGAKDPDEFLKKNGSAGVEKFKLLLDGSRTQFEFKLDGILSRYDISSVDEKIKAANELVSVISEVYSETEREVYIGVVSEKLDLPRDSLKNDVKRMIAKRVREKKSDEMKEIFRKTAGYGDQINADAVKDTATVNAEESILGILLLYPENLKTVRDGRLALTDEDFFSDFNRRIFSETMARYDETKAFDFGLLAEVFTPDEMGRITRMILKRQQLTDNGPGVLADMVAKLKNETGQKRLEKEGDDLAAIHALLDRQRHKLHKEETK